MHTNSLPAPSASIVPAASDQPSQSREATPSSKALTSAVSPPSTTDGVEDALADRVNSVQLDATQGILGLAVETRLNIYRHLIFVDWYKFCPHARLPLLVSSPGIGQPYYHEGPPVPCLYGNICGRGRAHHECLVAFLRTKTHLPCVNQVDLSLLRVSRRIRAEALDLFYSETIFYFEQHLTLASITFPNKRFNPLTLPTHLLGIPPQHLHLVKKIGFAVTDESALDHGFLIWRQLCEWINKNLPNLQHTYLFLFSPVTSSPSRVLDTEKQFLRPSDRFLIKTIDFLDTIPGHKTIEFRGSNKNKRIIGNILAAHFEKGRKKKDQSINVVGGCSCQCWMQTPWAQRNRSAHHWTGPDTLWPWLRDWNDEKARHARQGSFPPKWCSTHKGLLTGCLMCWRLTECIHDQKNKKNKFLKPGRISLDEASDGYGVNWGF
ncbi:MAG: hypothetical protein LQ349_002238 [Xanthoria aureola]|nr:MAG: hypothetical protein LQ349_002238 [Xanthoria aureola]